jgi:hypothetical protein
MKVLLKIIVVAFFVLLILIALEKIPPQGIIVDFRKVLKHSAELIKKKAEDAGKNIPVEEDMKNTGKEGFPEKSLAEEPKNEELMFRIESLETKETPNQELQRRAPKTVRLNSQEKDDNEPVRLPLWLRISEEDLERLINTGYGKMSENIEPDLGYAQIPVFKIGDKYLHLKNELGEKILRKWWWEKSFTESILRVWFEGEELIFDLIAPEDMEGIERIRVSCARYKPIFDEVCSRIGCKFIDNPQEFLTALAWVESGCKEDIVSSKGAIGLLQILPETAQKFGYSREQLFNPKVNATVAVKLLNEIKENTTGDIKTILRYYISGGNYDSDEIRRYIKNVVCIYCALRNKCDDHYSITSSF